MVEGMRNQSEVHTAGFCWPVTVFECNLLNKSFIKVWGF